MSQLSDLSASSSFMTQNLDPTMASYQLDQRKRKVMIFFNVLGVSNLQYALIKTKALIRQAFFC